MPADKQIQRRTEALKGLDDMIKEGRAYALLRQTKSLKAKDYHNTDLRLESLIPYVHGQKPLYVHANEVRQIEAAVHWANRHELKMIIVG